MLNTREQIERHVKQTLSPAALAQNDQRLAAIEEVKKLTRLTAHLNIDSFFESVTRLAATGDLVASQSHLERPMPMMGIMPASDTWTPFPCAEFWPLDLDAFRLTRAGASFQANGGCDHCGETLTPSELMNPCVLWMSAGTIVVEFHFCRKCGLYLNDRFVLTREAWRDFNGAM